MDAAALRELLADPGKDLDAEQLDALEEGGVRHAADVHLQDLAGVTEQLAQVQDPVGDLVGAAGEHHPARLVVGGSSRRRGRRAPGLGRARAFHGYHNRC